MNRILSKYFGPSTLITAAFIGPGTITICTIAGVRTGCTLLWALGFSVIATLVLQEMSARLGLVTKKGLGDAIRSHRSSNSWLHFAFVLLIIGAILIGNAAYEAGNISGAILGAEVFLHIPWVWAVFFGLSSFLLLYLGKYKWLEKFLTVLVILMSLCFLLTAILVFPNVRDILNGFVPSIPSKSEMLIVLGIIGTTVVPYNLFLHAGIISKKYTKISQLRDLRRENLVAVLLGGLISFLVIIVASSAQGVTEITNAKDLSVQLEPLLGSWAKYALGLGLLAAGLSSAITAPYAAAIAAKGLFGWADNDRDPRFRLVWMSILVIGVLFSLIGFKPILVIQFAQIANGLLLPIIAAYLLYLCNQPQVLGIHINSKLRNSIAIVVLLLTLVIAFKGFNAVFNFLA